jgi:putative NADPH-quinone reductase
MKVIVIQAAPRMEAGNTHLILDPFVTGMKNASADVDVILLGKMKIKRCIGCFTCYARTPGKCVHDDDVHALIEQISEADLFVLATPVYLDGMTGLAKSFIDRLVVFMDPHFEADDQGLYHPLRKKFPQQYFLVSVCGYPGLFNFDPLVLHMERMGRNLGSRFVGALLRPAVFSCLMTKKYPEKIKTVFANINVAGEELVRKGVVSEQVLQAVSADICSTQELKGIANASWDRQLEKSQSES